MHRLQALRPKDAERNASRIEVETLGANAPHSNPLLKKLKKQRRGREDTFCQLYR